MEKASPQQEGYVNNKCFGSCLALCTNWCDMWIRENGAIKKNKKQYKTATKDYLEKIWLGRKGSLCL